MEENRRSGAGRVGIVWGGIGGVVGLVSSLLAPFAGVIFAVFIGVSCGRRAAVAEEGRRSGDISGLTSGALAAPLFVMGAAAGAVLSAQQLGASEIAATFSEVARIELTPDEAWNLYLIGIAFTGVVQAALLIGASAAAGAWAERKRNSRPKE